MSRMSPLLKNEQLPSLGPTSPDGAGPRSAHSRRRKPAAAENDGGRAVTNSTTPPRHRATVSPGGARSPMEQRMSFIAEQRAKGRRRPPRSEPQPQGKDGESRAEVRAARAETVKTCVADENGYAGVAETRSAAAQAETEPIAGHQTSSARERDVSAHAHHRAVPGLDLPGDADKICVSFIDEDSAPVKFLFACVLAPNEAPQEWQVPTVEMRRCHCCSACIDGDECTCALTPFEHFARETCWRLHKIGLRVQLVQGSKSSQHKCVLRLGLPERVFQERYKKELLNQWRLDGKGMAVTLNWRERELDPSAPPLHFELNVDEKERVLLIARMLRDDDEALGFKGFGDVEFLDKQENHDPRVEAIFPLHDRDYLAKLEEQFKQIWNPFRKRPSSLPSHRERDAQQSAAATVLQQAERGRQARAAVLKAKHNRRNGLVANIAANRTEATSVAAIISAKLLGKRWRNITSASKTLRRSVLFRWQPTPQEIASIESLQSMYGDRIALFFVFQATLRTTLNMVLLVSVLVEILGYVFSYTTYLRITGLLGLLIPCTWGPVFLCAWDLVSKGQGRKWDKTGLVQTVKDNLNPDWNKDYETWYHKGMALLIGISLTVGGVAALIVVSALMVQIETMISITPLCGSWFHEHVWKDYATQDGKYAPQAEADNGPARALLLPLMPECYTSWDSGPTDFMYNGDRRGIDLMLIAMLEGILVGVVYTTVFTEIATYLAKLANRKTLLEFDTTICNFTYPFEMTATCSYYIILAVYLPFMQIINGQLFANDQALVADFNQSVVYTPSKGWCSMDDLANQTRGKECSSGMCQLELQAQDMIARWTYRQRFAVSIKGLGIAFTIASIIPLAIRVVGPRASRSYVRAKRRPPEARPHNCWSRWCCGCFASGGCCTAIMNIFCEFDSKSSSQRSKKNVSSCVRESFAEVCTAWIDKQDNGKADTAESAGDYLGSPRGDAKSPPGLEPGAPNKPHRRARRKRPVVAIDGNPTPASPTDSKPGEVPTNSNAYRSHLHLADRILVESSLPGFSTSECYMHC